MFMYNVNTNTNNAFDNISHATKFSVGEVAINFLLEIV